VVTKRDATEKETVFKRNAKKLCPEVNSEVESDITTFKSGSIWRLRV